jgi:hypothetical protein
MSKQVRVIIFEKQKIELKNPRNDEKTENADSLKNS